jgi:ribonucleoside-diphosphate reductase alpha chain
MDNLLMSGKSSQLGTNIAITLQSLRDEAVRTNAEIAKKLGINQSAAITCVKPSGTVSQLVDSASGIHARHNPYYIRTVRGDNKDPLTQFMIAQGIPNEPDVMKPDSTTVFSFPMQSPRTAITRNDMSAIEQLELWLAYQLHWCEHKPSVTISVKEHEWMEVGAWVYEHFDNVSGISFLPHSEHTYQQAPYQDIDEEQYKEFLTT